MKDLLRAFGSSLLVALLAVGASADTIYMKNGSVIRGRVLGYGNGEFTVQLNSGPGGARSRATLAGDEIDRIEFDGDAGGTRTSSAPSRFPDDNAADPEPERQPDPVSTRPAPRRNDPAPSAPVADAGRPGTGGLSAGQSDVTVDPKNDWTNTRFRVDRGSRIRITANGTVKLDPTGRRSAGPGGVDTPDRDKLMPGRPTGALIAVIGDDNDDFVFVGSQAEFVADRAGYLFLSVNEGNLRDNTGGFTAHVTVEPGSGVASTRTGGGVNGGRPTPAPTPARRNTTIPPDNTSAPRTAPAPVSRRDDPEPEPEPEPELEPDSGVPPSTTGGSVPATVAREGDVAVQANLDWTNTKMRVQRGNIVRITATGTVNLDRTGLRASPAGVNSSDTDKLLGNRPTGALIAVVGDDNDEFIFVGQETEFISQREGVLFLSVNEGNLKDNTGNFAAHVTIMQPQITAPTGSASPAPSPSSSRTGGGGGTLPKPVVDDSLGGGAQAPAAKAPRPVPAIGDNGGSAEITVSAKSDWASTGILVKKGMKIRITANGTVKLDAGGKLAATPAGIGAADQHKVMKDKPTGALIAVIGDDSSDYIFVGTSVEFTAQRDGLLFLGINEGELFDNTGAFTVQITVGPLARKK